MSRLATLTRGAPRQIGSVWRRGRSWPPVGRVRWGDLRRTSPLGGLDPARGTTVERHYAERFLRTHGADLRGAVLEISDEGGYARRAGGDHIEVLDVRDGLPSPAELEEALLESLDAVLVIGRLDEAYDLRGTVRGLHAALRPGGVVLATFPGIAPTRPRGDGARARQWSLTSLAARRLFEEVFSPAAVTAEAQGNVLAAVCALHRIPVEDVGAARLDEEPHPDYEVVVAVRALKPGGSS